MTTAPDGLARPLTRRVFNAGLLGLARSLVTPTLRLPPPSALPVHLFDFAVAGGWHHALGRHVGAVLAGAPLLLRAEPDNPHDALAVAVLRAACGTRLGYVPRVANAPVARLLAGGATVAVRSVGAVAFGRDAGRGWRVPDDLVFTTVSDGEPRLRLTLHP